MTPHHARPLKQAPRCARIEEVVPARVDFSGNPYLRLELKDGKALSIFFSCVGVRSIMGIFLLSKQRELTREWMAAINGQLKFVPTKKAVIKEEVDLLRILQIRYAKGEINKEQYEEMKRTLEL